MRVYVASSWRNLHYAEVVATLRDHGHEVWDWKSPPTGGTGFRWQDTGFEPVDYSHGDRVSPSTWLSMLRSRVAQAGFASDLYGMTWADAGVLLLPSGRSAHLEAGWMAGRGKRVHLLCLEPSEPDLMVLALGGGFCTSIPDLLNKLSQA